MQEDHKRKTSDFVLRVEAGVDQGQIFLLLGDQITVGRSSVADIEIHEIFAARRHFTIIWDEVPGAHRIIAWGINPVFINGVEVERNLDTSKNLEPGDIILLGDTVFVYDLASSLP